MRPWTSTHGWGGKKALDVTLVVATFQGVRMKVAAMTRTRNSQVTLFAPLAMKALLLNSPYPYHTLSDPSTALSSSDSDCGTFPGFAPVEDL